jgi:hypothetical protein
MGGSPGLPGLLGRLGRRRATGGKHSGTHVCKASGVLELSFDLLIPEKAVATSLDQQRPQIVHR